MRFKSVGNKRDHSIIVFKSSESSSSISRGQPVCFDMDATNDGLDAGLCDTAIDATAFFAGIACSDVAAGKYGEALIYGFFEDAMILVMTRGASSDSWTSSDSIASKVLLNIDTVNKCFSTSGGSQAKSSYLPFAVMLETIASYAASASATSDTRTAITTSKNIFVRAM